MFASLSKATFSVLANSIVLKAIASRVGLRRPHSFAHRFVAGETTADAIAAAQRLEARGLTVTLDHLGERMTTRDGVMQATRAYMAIVQAAADAGISRNLSVKLTQIGLDIDRATAIDNLRRVLDVATRADFFVRIDMEGSAYTENTLEVFESLWGIGTRNIGVVIQACLRRSPGDVARMNELGARVRLVKGAYREPKDVAFQRKAEVDAAYAALMEQLLASGTYPAIATHDPALIARARQFAADRAIGRERFELQMLYGIRRDLQRSLVEAGYHVRIYVPFGTDWFPYFMRRLGERPANLGFVFKSLAREEKDQVRR
jgi:proline dehydrogenase